MHVDTDIAIIGGGPVGAALALALQPSGLRVTLLEARTEHDERARDPRPMALSHGTRLLLERMNAWPALLQQSAATPIAHIHVSQRGEFGRVAISAQDADVPALGYVIDYGAVFSALTTVVRDAACDYREGARVIALQRDGDASRIDYLHHGQPASLRACLAVVADGGEIDGLAPPKIVDYEQCALTTRVRTTKPHQNTAYERFTSEGPLALLPYGDEMAVVWTLPPARAESLKAADSAAFLSALREAFGGRLGEFTGVGERVCYPLTLRYASDGNIANVVTIGNAAQTLHPVAGQGFNLGLRDAWELSQILRTLSVPELTQPETLRRFRASRRADRMATMSATHGLVRLFSNDFFPLNVMRGAAMTLLGSVAPVRNVLARRMIFGVHG